jgi:hypothetical protein
MKKIYLISLIATVAALFAACSDDVPYEQSSPQSLTLPEGTTLDESELFGVWTGSTAWGSTNTNYFSESYKLEFEDVTTGEAVLTHNYTDGSTEAEASIEQLEYTYTFNGKRVELTPKSSAKAQGATKIIGVHVGGDQMKLYTINNNYCDTICTLLRTGAPEPSVQSVNRTMPRAGETVKITGRNLQFVSQLYLPLQDGGELEVTDFTFWNRTISFTMPEGEFAPGSIRLHSDDSHISCFTPAYMFCRNCVFFHNFSTFNTSSPYTGTEFEFTIGTLGTLFSNVAAYSTSNLPAGHSLLAVDCAQPDSVLSLFGATPIDLAVASGTDDKKGYLRFSTADRFQAALNGANGLYTTQTMNSNMAVQMDIYVVTDGRPVWNSGYISYRLNKDQNSLTSASVANIAGWDSSEEMDFSEGWLTLTIPLTAFPMATQTGLTNLGALIASVRSSKLQTIFTFVNYTLDSSHPAHAMTNFQFNIADIRLVTTAAPQSVND